MHKIEKKGIDYMLNSKKPFPEWLKNHSVFKEMEKIDKVFPKIGLPNFKESADIMNSAEAMADAVRLVNKISAEIVKSQNLLYAELEKFLKSKDKDRNDICLKIQNLINISQSLTHSLRFADYAKVVEGKVALRLRDDIFNGEKNPIFRKNEAVLRVVNKYKDLCAEVKVNFSQVDQLQEFKDFSRTNIPNKKYEIVFSSAGEEGAWDISTISMRGVQSCQSWTAPQSRGLIGSIASKFVGVIYLASDQVIPGYGNKMLHRSLVRFCINKNTKKPAIVLDHIYPSQTNEIVNAFKKALVDKSGMEVLYASEHRGTIGNDYYVPDEPSRKFLRNGEFSYMDNQLPILEHKPSVVKKVNVNIIELTSLFKTKIATEIQNSIKIKRELYEASNKRFLELKTEYDAAKTKWEKDNSEKPEDQKEKFEMQEPSMEPEIAAFGKGGLENLLKHFDKKHGMNFAGKVITDIILDSFVPTNPHLCTSKEEYHRKYLMEFLKNNKIIKEKSWDLVQKGAWMKSFPKSTDKLFNMIYAQIKPYIVASCKEMIKKAN